MKRIRKALIAFLLVHMVFLIERTIFDSLGKIFLLVALNAVSILFVISAIYGGTKYHAKTLLTYVLWLPLWIGFNVLIIILYLEFTNISHKDADWLSLQQDGMSWFASSNFGCDATNSTSSFNSSSNCYFKYEHIEVIQASLQIFISILNFCLSVFMLVKLKEEDKEDHFSFIGGLSGNPQQRSSLKIRYVRDGYDIW